MLSPPSPTVLMNKNGKRIQVNMPQNLVLLGVRLPDNYEVSEPVSKLPPDTLLWVAGKSGYGLIDGNGTTIIEPKCRNISMHSSFHLKLEKVGDPEPKPNADKFDLDLGFQRSLHKDTPEGKAAQATHEGLIRFSDKGLFGFKDTAGKVKIPARYFAAREFSCGYAPVRLNKFSEDGRYVYIDHNGKTVSKEYFRAQPFVGKTAIISMYATRSLTHGLVDDKFAYIQEPYCHGLTRMKDGMVVPTRGMIHKVFDKNGKPVFDLPFNRTLQDDGANGLVFRSVEKGRETIEIYDNTGKIIKTSAKEVLLPGKQIFYHTNLISSPNNTLQYSVQTFDGKTVMGPTDDTLDVAGNNLVIKTIHSKAFSKEDWNGPDRDRERAFDLFLKQYKVTGMPKAEVEKYLGKGKIEDEYVVSYDLSANGSGESLGVIRYKDGKVESVDTRSAVHERNGIRMPDARARRVPIEVKSASGYRYNAFVEYPPGNGKNPEPGTLHINIGR